MAGLQLASEHHSPARGPAEKPAWLYRFVREPGTVQPSVQAPRPLQDACITEGDMVILSVEGVRSITCYMSCHSL